MLAVNQQPFIVFTPSTPTLSSTPFDDVATTYSAYTNDTSNKSPHRRASLYRSQSVPDPQLPTSTRQPVILHRPSSSLGSRWTFAKARRSFLESCWRTEKGVSAVSSAINDTPIINEKPTMSTRTMSDGWAARAQASWVEEDDGDFSEPDSTPSTPVFPHRALSSSSTMHGSRAITLISTFVIALAFASLAFTTFFHPTFGDRISKLPEAGDLNAPHQEEAWSHRFFHFDGMFGHSDDDGLVGISSSNMVSARSTDSGRELRKRVSASSVDYYGESKSSTSVVEDQPRRRWMPWYWITDTTDLNEDDEKVAFEHRRNLDQAAQRMERRRAALEKRLTAQRRW